MIGAGHGIRNRVSREIVQLWNKHNLNSEHSYSSGSVTKRKITVLFFCKPSECFIHHFKSLFSYLD